MQAENENGGEARCFAAVRSLLAAYRRLLLAVS
jgi:hypothetical protein